MGIKMKILDRQRLVMLNDSSIQAGRKQNLPLEQIPIDSDRQYIVNFHFEHELAGQPDVRMSVILRPGVLTAWLDVSRPEYDAIPEFELSELAWEAAVCVGTPRWTE